MVEIIAHRGVSSEAPENTLIAISKAIELGVDYIEIDIRLSRDGVPIVFHDSTTCRSANTGTRHLVSDMYSRDLKKRDAGKWFGEEFAGEPVPTLEDVLQLERRGVGLMIEIKEEHVEPKIIAKAVLHAIDNSKQSHENGPIIIGSFSPEILKRFQQYAPHQKLMGLIHQKSKLSHFEPLGIKHVGLYHKIINEHLISDLHYKGIRVWTYTVDDIEEAKALISIGVQGIISNNPRKLQNL